MQASGCENRYVKALGPPTKILDAIKCISLFLRLFLRFMLRAKIPNTDVS